MYKNYIILLPSLENLIFSPFGALIDYYGLDQANRAESLTFGQTFQLI